MNENAWISIEILSKFVPGGPINYIPALVQISTWRLPGDKPSFVPMMAQVIDTYMRHSASMIMSQYSSMYKLSLNSHPAFLITDVFGHVQSCLSSNAEDIVERRKTSASSHALHLQIHLAVPGKSFHYAGILLLIPVSVPDWLIDCMIDWLIAAIMCQPETIGMFQRCMWAFKSGELLNFQHCMKITSFNMFNVWVRYFCAILKVPFQISHKISYPYTERWVVYWKVKI